MAPSLYYTPTTIRPSLSPPPLSHIEPPTTPIYYCLLLSSFPDTADYHSSDTLLLFDYPPPSIHPLTTWPLCQQPYRLSIISALKRHSMYKYYPYTYKVLHVHTCVLLPPFSLLQYSPWGLIDILSQPVGTYPTTYIALRDNINGCI